MKFTVAIPCYRPNPALLDQTLQSVCSQLDRRTNQIVIVDDASPDASVCESAARRHGVELARTDEEIGGVPTHNAAYAMAQGDLVQILHPDDFVLPGFYAEVAKAATEFPGKALYATRCLIADHSGAVIASPRPDWLKGGMPGRYRDGKDFQPLHEGNPLCVAGCVLSRAWIAAYGGWDVRLYHCADWECWIRATLSGGACCIDWPLAVWRAHAANDSNRLARSGRNLRNFLDLAEIVKEYAPHLVDLPKLRAHVAQGARQQERSFRQAGELTCAAANAQLAREMEAVS